MATTLLKTFVQSITSAYLLDQEFGKWSNEMTELYGDRFRPGFGVPACTQTGNIVMPVFYQIEDERVGDRWFDYKDTEEKS